jgi:Protein of unknown function (DUF5818)
MPMGSQHLLSGIIERGRFGWALHADDGGVWELDAGFLMGWRLRQRHGRHVLVEGRRIDFNALWVERFWVV